MLERVPTQSQSGTAVNPISNAISWSIPVYSVDVVSFFFFSNLIVYL